MSAAGQTVSSTPRSYAVWARSCSMLAVPHTPQAEVVRKARVALGGGGGTPSASVTSMTL